MDKREWDQGTLLHTSGYYWKTCTLHTGVKLDIFTTIHDEKLPAAAVAQKISGDERGVATLLNALAAMGLLVKQNDLYANTTRSLELLSRHSDGYIGFMIMHHHHLVESWNKMDQAVLEGRPVRAPSSFADDAERESFLMGMFNLAMAIAPGLSKTLDLEGCGDLLDFGGGPGTYAVHFCMENPGLQARVYDLPTTRPFAERIINRFGMAGRVEFIPGDYLHDPVDHLAESFDAAWLSHVLHGESPEDAGMIVAKAVSTLRPGGKIFIHEFILNNTMDGPLFPALFSLNMLVGTPGGRAYSEDQLSDMLREHGVTGLRRLDFTGPTESGILTGTRGTS